MNIIIGLLFLAFILLIIIIFTKKSKNIKKVNLKAVSSNDYTSKKKTTKDFDFESSLKVENLKLPFLIETMTHNELAKAYEIIYDTFSFLDYPNKSNDELMKKEWHSWQMGIIFRYLAKNAVFIKPNHITIIPKEIDTLNKSRLDSELNLLVKKYYYNVDIHKSKNLLCNELEWTARDIAVVLKHIILKANK